MPKRYQKRRSKKKTSQAFRQKVLGVLNRQLEKKQLWSTWNETAITTLQASAFYDLSAVAQGDANGNRTGNEIQASGFHFKGVLNNNSTSITNYVRIVVFRAMADNSDMSYATSDLFAAANGIPQALSDQTGLNAMYYPIDKRLHKVYKDFVVKLAPNTATNGTHTKMIQFWIPLKGLKMYFEGSGTGDSNASPRLHFGMWTAEAPDDTSTGETVEVSGVGRFYFKDP